MGVGRVPRAHLLDCGREQTDPIEDVGVLSEKAEDQPCHEVVHVVAALGGSPFGVVFQQLDIKSVQPARGPYVEGAFAELFDGRDPGQRQEETEAIREIPIGAGDGFAGLQILRLKVSPVGCEDESRPCPDCGRAGLQRS
jgi:hypothetical protein